MDEHTVASRHASHVGAGGDDLTGGVRAGDVRQDDTETGQAATRPDVVVVTAGGAYADEAVGGSGLWLRDVLKPQLVAVSMLVKDDRPHSDP